tara:strand:+ start:3929 stop:5152 length:1224 start_codon:yes stop_codon:yes gene_type:complete
MSKKILTLLISVFSSTLIVWSQSYIELIDKKNLELKKIIQAEKNFYYVVGEFFKNDNKDLIIFKIDENNEIIWRKEINHKNTLVVNDVILDTFNNNIVIAAEQYTNGNREALYALSFNKNGNKIFSNLYNENGGEVEPYSLIADKSGYTFIGFTKIKNQISNLFYPVYTELQYGYMLKLNKNGEKLWSRIIKDNQDINSITKIINFNNEEKILVAKGDSNIFYLLKYINENQYLKYKISSNDQIFITDISFSNNEILLSGIVRNNNKKDNYDLFTVLTNHDFEIKSSFKIKSFSNDLLNKSYNLGSSNFSVYGQTNFNNKKKIVELSFDQNLDNILVKKFDYFSECLLYDAAYINNMMLGVGTIYDSHKKGVIYNFSEFENMKNDFIFENFNLQIDKIGLIKFESIE